jgi:hypothetical protein
MATRKYFRQARRGPITMNEKDAVAAIVMDQPGPISAQQEKALAVTLRRSPAAVKALIEEAREHFAAKAGRYVEIHAQGVEDALKNGTVAGLDVALKGSQWAIERIAQDGSRIVDKAADTNTGTKIVIGVQMGGITPPVVVER